MPAEAGIQYCFSILWIPAFAGMTQVSFLQSLGRQPERDLRHPFAQHFAQRFFIAR